MPRKRHNRSKEGQSSMGRTLLILAVGVVLAAMIGVNFLTDKTGEGSPAPTPPQKITKAKKKAPKAEKAQVAVAEPGADETPAPAVEPAPTEEPTPVADAEQLKATEDTPAPPKKVKAQKRTASRKSSPKKPETLRDWLNRADAVYSLHEAAEAGDLETIKARIQEGADIEQRDELGRSPLLIAAEFGHTEVVDFLLSKDADASVQDKNERKLTDYYRGKPLPPAVEKALYLAQCREKTVQAIERGDLETVQNMLAEGVSPSSRVDQRYLLQCAFDKSNREIIRCLLEAGADPNVRFPGGKFPLHVAAGAGWTDICQLLIEKGANPNGEFRGGVTALHEAIYYNKVETVDAMLPYYAESNFNPIKAKSFGYPVSLVIERNHVKILEVYLRHGFKVDDTRFAEEPLLISATLKQRREIIQLLLKAGADKYARDTKGKCAIDYADKSTIDLFR